MNIPSSKVLDKISELAAKAKAAETAEQERGYVLAIKALCELLVQEEFVQEEHVSSSSTTTASTSTIQQSLPMDDANGSSLLDF